MSDIKVSIIIPVYNAEKFIGRCISSLKNQTLKDIEIILVNDSSTDGTLKILEEESKKDERIKVISKKNEGAGLARNAGLAEAVGEYIGFIDSDDYADAEMFEILYNAANKYDSDLVMSGVVFKDGAVFSEEGLRTEKKYFEKDTHFTTKEELNELKLGIAGARPEDEDDSKYGMSVWKNLFRREIIEKNQLKFMSERETLSEDALFMIDYISHIKKATGIPPALYNYCRNEESISKTYKKDRFDKGMVFVEELEKRYKKDIPEKEYSVYINRFIQAFGRFVCSQEIMYAQDRKIPYPQLKERLKRICTHPVMKNVLKTYPLGKLPLKQQVFARAMKSRMYLAMKIIVGLRR